MFPIPVSASDGHCPPAPGRGGAAWPDTDLPVLNQLRTGTEAEQSAALLHFFQSYAPPLRRYIRQKWPKLAEEDVDDLASEFSTRCLTGEHAYFRTYDPQRFTPSVRLRTYLCRILDHYLSSRRRHANAMMRGGGHQLESLDTTNPAAHQETSALGPHGHTGVDTLAYDRHWARHILSLAFAAVDTGTPTTRAAIPHLRPWILADPGEDTLKDLAKTLGRTHGALRAQLHRLRESWRQAVRQAVARTVPHPDEIDDELRHLASVLSQETTGLEGEACAAPPGISRP